MQNLFLSVGAMKAGTTWLYEKLKDHPEIYFTPIKEIHYFANLVGIGQQTSRASRLRQLKRTLTSCSQHNQEQLLYRIEEIQWYLNYAKKAEIDNNWYRSLFASQGSEKFSADFSNLYCRMGDEGWSNVRKISENTKAIYTLRDPISRLWSHYKFHFKFSGDEDEVISSGFEKFKAHINDQSFWANAEYSKNYLNLRKNLKEDQLMLLYFEDFRQNPIEKILEVQDFLGIERIPPDKKNLEKRVNRTKELELPDEWRDYMLKKLQPVCEEMKDIGIWHSSWESHY